MYQYNKTIQKMTNFDDFTKGNVKEHNSKWPQMSDYLYWILIIGGSGYEKLNSLFNLMTHQPDIDQIYKLKIHMKQNITF